MYHVKANGNANGTTRTVLAYLWIYSITISAPLEGTSALRSVCNFMGWAIIVYAFVKLHPDCNVTPCNLTV